MKKIKVPIEKSVGLALAHDITYINKDEGFKGARFKKGHIVEKNDIEILKSIGKNYIYQLIPEKDDIHEDDFALEIAPYIAGENVFYDKAPSEGKISFYSSINGLLKIDRNKLFKINALSDLSLPCIHNNFACTPNKTIAAFRIIPLYAKKNLLDKAKKILSNPLFNVIPYTVKKINVIITGNEIYYGLRKDKFKSHIESKLKKFNYSICDYQIVPDDINSIIKATQELSYADLLFVCGGSSVDPDDVTKIALGKANVKFVFKSNPIQPANNLSVGYLNDTTVCVVPAGSLYYKASALDIFLPRLLAKDKIDKKELKFYSEGGLCNFCDYCTYPICSFGK
ncbi:molybdopterin-binding protein [Desulfurella sp.]|uniref:molybdopterin-binding protein n=1 Tax=Desulfurella sp. TaxID=1962857 RepID=UPI0025C4ED4B|nr:molybdopterin-binding protein [Desulfurella sp.]